MISPVRWKNKRKISFQYKLARCAWAEMYRSVADLMHHIRVPGTHGVLRGAVRYPLRQELEPAASGPAASSLRGPAGAAAITYQPFAGQCSTEAYMYNHSTTIWTTYRDNYPILTITFKEHGDIKRRGFAFAEAEYTGYWHTAGQSILAHIERRRRRIQATDGTPNHTEGK